MAKQLTKRQRRAVLQAGHNQNGGLIQVSFTFGGKKHQESHRLTASEIQGQMEALKRFGLSAIEDSTLCLVAIASGRLLGQHVITEAFKDFIRENWKPDENAPTAQEVVDELARRRGIPLNKEQLNAVDDTAGLEPLVGREAIATIEHREDGTVKLKDLQLVVEDAKILAEEENKMSANRGPQNAPAE